VQRCQTAQTPHRLDDEPPGAAESVREGLRGDADVMGLRLSERLQRSLTTTHASDQSHATRQALAQAEDDAHLRKKSTVLRERWYHFFFFGRLHSRPPSIELSRHRLGGCCVACRPLCPTSPRKGSRPPIPRPERFLMSFQPRPARSEFRADATQLEESRRSRHFEKCQCQTE
jgi:hypothetical protein